MVIKNINSEKLHDIVIFQPKGTKIALEVKLKDETVWPTQGQMSELFLTERSVITKHIHNIFETKELGQKSNVQKMHIPNSDKPVNLWSGPNLLLTRLNQREYDEQKHY